MEINDERMGIFIDSFEKSLPKELEEIKENAKNDNVPIIRNSTIGLLRFLICSKKPIRILEVGTAVGFSALCMAEFAPKGTTITTIEKYEKRIPVARENFRKAGREKQIILLEGDAAEVLKTLDEPFDFIFMDAAKGQYLHFLPDVLRLLKSGGVLVSDNVLQEGDIIESRYAVERRNRTIYKRMREYLYELKHNNELVTSLIPLGDGVALSTKR